ncbi:MAG: MFS transporter [Candidatus Bathyarchaeota archaeon]|nr:MFS transporter [Candidatus Bathyarchaeota archaeon]
MFDAVFRFFKELDRRIKVLFVFLGIHTWHRSLPTQYNQLYATSLGATPIELGSLESVGLAASSIISVPSGWIADKYGVKKVILIGLALTAVVSAIYGFADTWWTLIPAILLSGACMRMVMPYVDVLFINYSKPEQRSMVMSLSRTLWAIPRIFTSMIAALIITHFGGMNAAGIRPLYFIQLVLGSFVFLAIALWLKTPTQTSVKRAAKAAEEGGGFIQDFRDVFKGEKWLKRWVIVMILRNAGMRLSLPFTPLWIVNEKGADPYLLGIMGTVGMLVSILLQIPAGRLADKIGRKRTFYLFRPFAYLGTLLLVFAPRVEYLIVVGILGYIGVAGGGGGLSGVSFIPFITMNFEMVPEEKRGRWLGILGFFNILSFPVSILGGFMWQQGLMVEVLLLPILLEVLIAIPVLRTVPDTLDRTIVSNNAT